MEASTLTSRIQDKQTLNTPTSTGALAARAACSAQHVRNLERQGVLPPSTRAANGYRTFGETHLHALLAYRHLSTALGPVEAKQVVRDLTNQACAVGPRMDELHARLHAERLALRRAVTAVRTVSGEEIGVPAAEDVMTIGELAAALGVRTSTLRHWESEGLLHPARRGRSRSYSPTDARDARIVDQLRRAGYRIPDVHAILDDVRRSGTGPEVFELLDRRAAALDARSRALLAAAPHLLALAATRV